MGASNHSKLFHVEQKKQNEQNQNRILWSGRLVYGKDSEYGGYGWKTANAPENFNVSDPNMLTLTHDLLEHTDGESASVYNEFRALGAVLAVRGEITLNNRFSYDESISNDWSSLAYDLINDPEPIAWQALQSLPEDDQYSVVYFTREQYKLYRNAGWKEYRYSSDNADMQTARTYCIKARHAFNAMQEGYIAACERFAGIDDMRSVFLRVQANLKRMLDGESAEIYGECKCTVYANGDVRIEWPESEYDYEEESEGEELE